MRIKKEIHMSLKKLLTLFGILTVAGVATGILVYNANIVPSSPVAYTQNYVINLDTTPNASGIARLSAQAVYSSATLVASTFNDGRVSTASLTVNTIVGLSTATATDQITISANSVIQSSASSNSLVVASTNGLTGAVITLNGTKVTNNGWRVDTAAHTAADIATELTTFVYPVISTAASSTVSMVARSKGTAGNAFTLVVSTPSALTVGSATFTGGKDPAFRNQSITVNGTSYARGYYWNLPNDPPETSTGTAVSVAALLNTISGMHASASGSVVYATATVAGSAANSFTIVSSTPAAMAVAHPTFTGGVDNACVAINGTSLCANSKWYVGASTAATAHSISDAIVANASLSTIVVSTWNSHAVITSTSTKVGTLSNYTLTSSTPAAISVSNPTYTGGQNASFAVGSPQLLLPAHGWTTAVPVLLSTGGATPPSPLVNQTTYYVIRLDANDVELATTSARAQAGQYLTFASSTTTGPHTMTLTPLAMAGTPGIQWQVSNDCVNYTNFTTTALGVAVSSIVIPSPYTAGATTWDLGPVNYQCIQAAFTGPTAGALNLQINVNGSNP